MAELSPEQRKLKLINNLDLRIVNFSNNAEKLQDLLDKYLPALLLEAGSEFGSVRQIIIGDMQKRIWTYIQPEGIVLPVAKLLEQYTTVESKVPYPKFVRMLDLRYLRHSIWRIAPNERAALVPTALKGIAANLDDRAHELFNLFLVMLLSLKLPPRGSKEDESFRVAVGLEDPKDASYVATMLGRLLCLVLSGDSPGLNEDMVKTLTLDRPDTWTTGPASGTKYPMSLSEVRVRVVNFLASGAFTDEERFMPAIYAASHTDSRVSSVGEELLKRSTVSLEDISVVEALFEKYHVLTVPYRIRILNLLSKSAVSTKKFENILLIVQREMGTQKWHGTAATGLEQTKLYNALFSYINWVARNRRQSAHAESWEGLITCFRDFVVRQGWPKPAAVEETSNAGLQSASTRKASSQNDKKNAEELRLRAYECIGLLAQGALQTTADKIGWASWLFRSLSEDPTPSVAVSIDGALSSLMSVFDPAVLEADTYSCEQLKSLLLAYMTMPEESSGVSTDDAMDIDTPPTAIRSTRHAATKWANHCLPFSDVTARWIDILAIAGRRDERSEVVEEGRKGLDPWTYHSTDGKQPVQPRWHELVSKYFMDRKNMPINAQQAMNLGNFTGDRLGAYPLALAFCEKLIFLDALDDFDYQPGWEPRLESLVTTDEKTRCHIRSFLGLEHDLFLYEYLFACFEGMLREEHQDIVEQSAKCFVNVASLSPVSVLANLTARAGELLHLIKSNRKEIRVLGARAIGMLNGHPENPQTFRESLNQRLADMAQPWKTSVGSELNAVEGAFLALGHSLSRRVFYAERPKEMEITATLDMLPSAAELEAAAPSLKQAVVDALSQLWTAGIEGFPKDSHQPETVQSYLEVLAKLAGKADEHAITALGRLAMIAPTGDEPGDEQYKSYQALISTILEKLLGLHEIKQAETHFTIGEAITAAVACWDSDVVKLTLDVMPGNGWTMFGRRSDRLKEVMDKLITDCKTTKPSLLKASGIWLFCLIQNCSQLQEVQDRLRDCQVAFMRLLSARDELVQETASRGLSLVYEKGNKSLKDDLVKDLVSSFTGSGPQLKVDEDTELFDAGALPTGDGKSITSYKDIVSLANEVGDQSLVYKFMSLANNAATWTTRSAFGRFGLSNILSESEVDPKLYPKLYRYRFDPNSNVRKSMDAIWKALVKDSNAVIETHFDAIMDDLLKSIHAREYRVREASCAAIADLIQGRPFPAYQQYYSDIWVKVTKVLDDIKGSVRAAALKLCIGLSNTLVRSLEEGSTGSASREMMKEALPFLLSEKGMESDVEDVKILATITVMKIAKDGGKALRPFIPTMVPQLLGLLSTIEHQVVNYAYLRSNQDEREKIDKARASAVSQSPISQAIDDCLRFVDADVMKDLSGPLSTTMKTAIGMPTKVGCSRVLSTLATRHAGDLKPYTGQFLKQLQAQALDKNDTVSSAYAKGAAYVMRVAPAGENQAFVERFIVLYFASENETRRQKCADVVLALSKTSPDVFNSLEQRLLPFAYIGSHDPDGYVKKAFKEVWDSHAGSALSVARYVPEIVDFANKSFNTAQWALKHGGALAVAAMTKTVTGASNLSGHVDAAQLKTIWPVLEQALALKTFPEKERVVDAYASFVAKSRALWEGDAAFAKLLHKIMIREAKRNNAAYRIDAFAALWKFAEARDDLDMHDEISDIVRPYIVELVNPDDEQMDIDKTKEELAMADRTAAAALEAIARGYSRATIKKSAISVLRQVWQRLEQLISSPKLDIIRREVWYKCVVDLMADANKAAAGADGDAGELPTDYFNTLDVDKTDVGTEEQRSLRIKAALGIAQAVKQGVLGRGQDAKAAVALISAEVSKAMLRERSLDVQKLMKEAVAEMNEPSS